MMIKTIEMTPEKLAELDLLLIDIRNELLEEFPGNQSVFVKSNY